MLPHGILLLLIPSRDGDGSNAMIFAPGSMGFHYGAGSAKAHREEAEFRGLVIKTLDLAGFGLDIDTPEDLQALVSLEIGDPRPSLTGAFLTKYQIAGRLG